MEHHESATGHVTGQAVYIEDLNVSDRLLAGLVVYSPHARAGIKNFDLKNALNYPGVEAVLSYRDIPGTNQMGPVVHDEPCLAEKEVTFIGQAVFLIAAQNLEIAREAAKLIEISYQPLEPVLTLEKAIETGKKLAPPRKIVCGDLKKGFESSAHQLEGSLTTGGQEHWYLETQSAMAVPGEGSEVKVYSSSQHPSETQAIVAEVLGIARNEVEVEVKRMGGAFGGKETQANHVAAWAALLANSCGQPVKIHLDRDTDQIITGKRHKCFSQYRIGFNDDGKIEALDLDLHLDAGSSTDLTMAILERAMFHVDNAYYIPSLRVNGHTWKTNYPSNTAFRGFGGPQGMAVIENIIDRIARFLKMDALDVRKVNFYGETANNTTHYGQLVENNRLPLLYPQLTGSSRYFDRRKVIDAFNRENEFVKKGLALTPVKFGISFTTSFLNQAGALVNIYQDGTVLVNHGGTEMGQGLHTKIRAIAAAELGIDPKNIRVNATNTSKVPNTSATAASSGSDLNGMAVKDAIDKLKSRLSEIASKEIYPDGNTDVEVVFADDFVFDKNAPGHRVTFKELIPVAYRKQVSLSATGYYRTPGLFYEKEAGKGKPFHYFAFGMAVSEVVVDVLTGHVKLLRTDILHDAGKSINKSIDLGQIEGGFIQGMGWCTTEDLKYDETGKLLNHSPDTYKIPTIRDIPEKFVINFLKNAPNPNTIRQSKAVGEPPFMLALSVWLAIKDAVSAVGDHQVEPELPLPATNEAIVLTIEKIKTQLKPDIPTAAGLV